MDARIEQKRQEIDRINHSILELLNKRTQIVKQIAEIKDEIEMEYFDPERETEMIKKIISDNDGPLHDALIKEIFISIHNASLQFLGTADK